MKKILQSLLSLLLCANLYAQNFEVTGVQDSYKGFIGDVIKAPLSFKNTSSKSITLIIKKTNSLIGTSQQNYFCQDGHCLDQKVEDYSIRLEPGETLSSLQIALESGLAPGLSSVKYLIYNRHQPLDAVEVDLNFIVEERPNRQNIYSSPNLTIQEVYPNPASHFAEVGYKILDKSVKAKIILNNVLGTTVGEYELPSLEDKIKINTDNLKEGIYFYTLYEDQKAVITKKLVINR